MMENKLLKAVLEKSLSQVKECVMDGEDPFFKDEHDRTYLHLSVYLKSAPLVEYFLEEGISIHAKDCDNLTALHRACRNGCESIVKLLMDYGATVHSKAKDSITPIHICAAFGHTGCIEILCKSFRDHLELCDDNKHTPLHFASAEGHSPVVALLLKVGANANAENASGNRPLHFAAASQNSKLCQILIGGGAVIDAQNQNGQTALHIATLQGCMPTVIELLKLGADPNIRDVKGSTCSHIALKNGKIDLIKILMHDPRTDPSVHDNEKNTVLHTALKSGHFNLMSIMIPRARDLTKQDATGCSVIIEAIRNQNEELALEMLRACPSLAHTTNHDYVTPLHLAAERGMKNLTHELLIAGAHVDAMDCNGLTPSLYCAKNDSVLECLSMIEDIMTADSSSSNNKLEGNNSKKSPRISS